MNDFEFNQWWEKTPDYFGSLLRLLTCVYIGSTGLNIRQDLELFVMLIV